MTLHKITSPVFKKRIWEKFKKHHYTPEDWSDGVRVFLATEVFDGKDVVVGMSAAIFQPHPDVPNAWRSHKVVVLPLGLHSWVWESSEQILLPDFDRIQMWRVIADAQAALFVKEGHPYFCNAGDAPSELVAYRDDPASGWVPTSKNGKPPRDNGHHAKGSNRPRATNAEGLVVSHWYVGAGAALESPLPDTDSIQPEIPALEEATEPSSTAEAPGSTPLVEPETAGVTTTEGICMPFCTAKLKSGRPCLNVRNLRNGLCSIHDPEAIKERAAVRKQQDFEFEVEQAYDDLIFEMEYGNDEIEGREPSPDERRQMLRKVCDTYNISYEAGLKILDDHFMPQEELAILREAGAA